MNEEMDLELNDTINESTCPSPNLTLALTLTLA
jgi:hypothetical protein